MTEKTPTQKPSAKRKGGRPAKPAIFRNRDGSRSVRTTVTIEGERVRRQVNVGTSDPSVAKARGKRLAAGNAPELLAGKQKRETFREVATELLDRSSLATVKVRRSRLERFAYPIIGDLPVDEINVGDIRQCLEQVRQSLGWTDTARLLKNDISAVLGHLYASDVLSENAALRIKFCKKYGTLNNEKIKKVVLPRIVLSDAEFNAFIAWGLEVGAGQLPELYMLALCARCLGGMRASDLHAWRWEHIDTADWLTAEVPRPKTELTARMGQEGDEGLRVFEPYELGGEAAQLVPYLAAWWRRHGCPSEGAVFPVRRGHRAGERKVSGASYAKKLRMALWEAGIVRPLPGYSQACQRHGAQSPQARKLCALQSGIDKKRARLDFHSFRRGWVGATTSAKGLSFAESMRLADHSDPATHAGYRSMDGARVIPGGVLPLALPKLPTQISKSLNDYRCVRSDSNARPLPSEGEGGPSPRQKRGVSAGSMHSQTPPNTTQRQNSLPKLEALNQAVESLRALGQHGLADELLSREMPDHDAPVVKLEAVRSKRRS